MSNSLAIGAVTATLRRLIEKGIAGEATGIHVTTFPPDKARTFGQDDGDGRVNLFLYQTQLNAAWRNLDLPRQSRPGETGHPPLAIDLLYLVTAYEKTEGDATLLAHRLLGRAMHTLHDHPVLGSAEIEAALAGSELQHQLERVRITPHPMSAEELSKLWVIFQTEYRISAAYQVSAVLIESKRPSRTPLPVLSRGLNDTGVAVQSNMIPPYPAIESVELPALLKNAALNAVLTIKGHHLDGSTVSVRASHRVLADPVPLTLEPNPTAAQVQARIPNQPANYPPGFYSLQVVVRRQGETFDRTTNELSFALAPRITNDPVTSPIGVTRNANEVTVTLDCEPAVRPGQRVALLLGDREVSAQPIAAPATHLQFIADTRFAPIAAGKYFLRLRVDGVDSELVKYSGDPPKPAFDIAQQITVP